MTPEEIFSHFAGRVLLLTCGLYSDDSKLASGVLVSANGFVITNAHVVEGCQSITADQIKGDLKRSYNAVLMYYDRKQDTAVLKIEGRDLEFFDLPSRAVRTGERVYAIGNPRGLEQSISEGIVSGLRRDDNGALWIQHTAPISPGSSGGALISSRGELLGINAWSLSGSQGLNFAVPTPTLARAYSDAHAAKGALRFPSSRNADAPVPAAPRGGDRPLPTPPPLPMPSPGTPRPPGGTNPPGFPVLVRLNVTVSDKAGHRVTGLPEAAFTVLENGVPQVISEFKRGDVPVSLGLVIDNSTGMRPKRASVEAAALDLVKDTNPQDEVFVVNFNDDAYFDNPNNKDFLTDIDEIKEALRRIDSRGGTAMRDAISKSIEWLKKAHKEKKVLAVVTDGIDNASTESLEDLLREARQSDVLIYCMGLLNGDSSRDAARARQELNALAEASGGETYYPKDISEVVRIAHQAAHDIHDQYTIEYSPRNKTIDGAYRQIRVLVKGPGHLVARARQGYFATKGSQSDH